MNSNRIIGMRGFNQGSGEYQMVHQQTNKPFYRNKMLIANTCELDQLPFLKNPHFNWLPDLELDGEKTKVKLLDNLRSISYQCSDLMSKIFACSVKVKYTTVTSKQNKTQQNEQLRIQQLIVTTEKEIFSLQKFIYLANQSMSQSEFSPMVTAIKKFENKTKEYIRDLVSSKYEINFKNKEFLSFGIYLQKHSPNSLEFKKQNENSIFKQFIQKNSFYIKCAVNNFIFQPSRDTAQVKTPKPEPFLIKNPIIIERLFKIYLELTQTYLPIRPKDIKQYTENFDRLVYFDDESYLELQVLKNFPLLRSKFYLPVVFNDKITHERLDGPIFSNSDPDCMFGHFIGYNADSIKELEGNHCQQCRSYIEGVQQNPILTNLRDNPFNPHKTDVLFCPQFNRFKLILKKPVQKQEGENSEEEEEKQRIPKFKTQIKYLNYLHFRSNLKKLSTKKRNKFNDMLENEHFSLTFPLWGRKVLILDPARGRNCFHYEFTDLRAYYLNKVTESTFQCPICKDVMSDNDILYLKEAEILLKYLKFKCSKFKELVTTGECFINHELSKLFLGFKRKNKENKDAVEKDTVEISGFYEHFIDPYIPFNHYALGIPDKYQQKLNEIYMFSNQNAESKDSDEDFEFKESFHEIEAPTTESLKSSILSQSSLG